MQIIGLRGQLLFDFKDPYKVFGRLYNGNLVLANRLNYAYFA